MNEDQKINQEELSRPFIIIEFQSSGSVVFSIKTNDIYPQQMLLLSSYFEFLGKEELMKQKQLALLDEQRKAEMSKIAIPGR